jgi:prepilin-type N-terminal cleavage/methylation domain-containing protein
MMPAQKNVSAFTLIELSIVLVVIGLIVGGVVGGKSLIKSARLSKVVSGFSTLKTAINTFELQYDSLPGDMPDAYDYFQGKIGCNNNTFIQSESIGCNGNGDGKINWSWGAPREIRGSYMHLVHGDMLSSGSSVLSASSIVPGTNMPEGPMDNSYYLIGDVTVGSGDTSPTTIGASSYYNTQRRQIFFSGLGYSGQSNRLGGILTATDAKSIDKKMDDGEPATGRLLIHKGYSKVTGSTLEDNCTNDVSTSAVLSLSSDEKDCMIMLKID